MTAALSPPTPLAVQALLTASGGLLRQVTIDAFVSAGVIVAVGHTETSYDIAAEAFDRGASLLTHAFNAVPGLEHRAQGPVGAALDRGHVVLEVLADGLHVHPTVIRTLFAALRVASRSSPTRCPSQDSTMASISLADLDVEPARGTH